MTLQYGAHRWFICFLPWVFLWAVGDVYANDAGGGDGGDAPGKEDTPPVPDEEPVWQRAFDGLELDNAWDWLESRRDDVSRNVGTVSRSLDDWLAGEAVGERANDSYLRLKLNQRVGRNDAYFSNVRIGGSLDLPRAMERWKLLFESEDNDTNSLSEQRLDNIVPSTFSGILSYELEDINGWRFNHDFGLRAEWPPDPFYRFRTRYDREIGESWLAGLDQRSYYFLSDGWGNDLRAYVGRELNETTQLRFTSEVHYRHELSETEFGQYVSLHRSLGEMETISYEAGLLGVNRSGTRLENYYVQVVYRKAVHEDWLVLEVVPQVLMDREESWKIDPRMQVNLEVYFFE